MSQVQRAYQQLSETEGAEPLLLTSYLSKARSKEVQIEICRQRINQVSKWKICAYSDGSSEGNGRSAWGFVLKRKGKTLLTGSGIRHGGEALDAEITGASKALEAALGLQSAGQRVYLSMDSQQAINIRKWLNCPLQLLMVT